MSYVFFTCFVLFKPITPRLNLRQDYKIKLDDVIFDEDDPETIRAQSAFQK